MHLKIYKSLWGMEGSLEDQLSKVVEAGYDGIETPLPESGADSLAKELADRGLGVIGQIFVNNADDYRRGLDLAAKIDAKFVNVQTGKDWLTFSQGAALFEELLRIQAESHIKTVHETHRGKILCNPWTTERYLREFPSLKIAADYSHFTCVCESTLWDQKETMAFLNTRVEHIHARVGYDQGPQVPDPRAPEYEGWYNTFEVFWDAIYAEHEARGESEIFLDPEFGPPGYLHTLPFTQSPVTNLWEVCLYVSSRARNRWSEASVRAKSPRAE